MRTILAQRKCCHSIEHSRCSQVQCMLCFECFKCHRFYGIHLTIRSMQWLNFDAYLGEFSNRMFTQMHKYRVVHFGIRKLLHFANSKRSYYSITNRTPLSWTYQLMFNYLHKTCDKHRFIAQSMCNSMDWFDSVKMWFDSFKKWLDPIKMWFDSIKMSLYFECIECALPANVWLFVRNPEFCSKHRILFASFHTFDFSVKCMQRKIVRYYTLFFIAIVDYGSDRSSRQSHGEKFECF